MKHYENKAKLTLVPNIPKDMKSLILSLYMISALLLTLGIGGGILALFNSTIFDIKLAFLLSIGFSTGIGLALLVYQRSFRTWVRTTLFDQEIIEFTRDAILFIDYSDLSIKRKVSPFDVESFKVYEREVINPTITTNFPRIPRFNRYSKERAIELTINYHTDENQRDKIKLNEYCQNIQKQKDLIAKILGFAEKHYTNLKIPVIT